MGYVLDGSNIENTVAECTKRDRRGANISSVSEHHLQDSNIPYNGRRDACNEKKAGREEEEKDANVVEDTGSSHLEDLTILV